MKEKDFELFEKLTEDEQLKYLVTLELDAGRYQRKILSEYWQAFKKDWEEENKGFYVRIATYWQYFQVKLPQRESLTVSDWKNGETETISDEEFEKAYEIVIDDFKNNYLGIFKLYGND